MSIFKDGETKAQGSFICPSQEGVEVGLEFRSSWLPSSCASRGTWLGCGEGQDIEDGTASHP